MVNNYEVTEFKMNFSPSATGNVREGRICCKRRIVGESWDMSVKITASGMEDYSLYEIAEAITDTFAQEQQEIRTIYIKISEETEPIRISKTDKLESVLEQFAKGFIPERAGNV